MDIQSEFEIVMGALELGIIPPNRSIDESLALMDPVERRICKRKYRKIARTGLKVWGMGEWSGVAPSTRRRMVISECRRRGQQMVEQSTSRE